MPGDKSISHRALLLAAIARGESRLAGLADGADVRTTRHCLEQLGVEISGEDNALRVLGEGLAGLRAPADTLDCGNSGTTMRLLAGILATQRFTATMTGDDSLRRRPMRRIIDPLRQMGAQLESSPNDTAPLTIRGGKLRGIRYEMPVASAQVKSCMLLAALGCEGETVVVERMPTRDHTERMLQSMGATISVKPGNIRLQPGELQGINLRVPGDFSSGAYFIAAAALLPGSDIRVHNLNLNPTRSGLLTALREMGAELQIAPDDQRDGEPCGEVRVRSAPLRALDIANDMVPQLIDEIPILAIMATQAEGTTRILGASELRHKECDRIAALAINLRAMGARIEEQADGLIITGPSKLHGAEIDSFGDHRIAMSFAIAGLLADSPTRIHNAACVEISFPGFFDTLSNLITQ